MAGSLQDAFLAECKTQAEPVTAHFTDGSTLRGIVKGFDPFTIVLEDDRGTHLLYKHAISMISPDGRTSQDTGA
jgi:host factor-I protein